MTRVEVRVQGMNCGGCERAVQAALGQLDGVSGAEADHTAGRVRVSYDPEQVDEQRLRAQIEDAGYQPAPA